MHKASYLFSVALFALSLISSRAGAQTTDNEYTKKLVNSFIARYNKNKKELIRKNIYQMIHERRKGKENYYIVLPGRQKNEEFRFNFEDYHYRLMQKDFFDLLMSKEKLQGRQFYILEFFHPKPYIRMSDKYGSILSQIRGHVWIEKDTFEIYKITARFNHGKNRFQWSFLGISGVQSWDFHLEMHYDRCSYGIVVPKSLSIQAWIREKKFIKWGKPYLFTLIRTYTYSQGKSQWVF